MRRGIALSAALGATCLLGLSPKTKAQVGALTTDCTSVGYQRGSRAYQFVVTCPGRTTSPDGRFAIVQHAYRQRQSPVTVQDAKGTTIARLMSISDDMPFSVLWSPDSRWIAINHHVGSFMDDLRVFGVAGGRIAESRALVIAAKREAVGRYPCLKPAAVLPNAIRWSRDGHHLILVTMSSLYACSDTARRGDWWPVWMIGNVKTGAIDPASVRIDRADGPLQEPRDALYRRF